MITAAEKMDKIPPWCVVKNEPPCGWCVRDAVTPPNELGKFADKCGTWNSGEWIATESEARRIARLTRPLDSWEPAPDCPLPVEGWMVQTARNGDVWLCGQIFPTILAAIVWAWTEAEHTDGTGATDGPGDRGVLGWEAYDELCKTVDALDGRVVEVASIAKGVDIELAEEVDKTNARVAKVEGVLARICPEADEQTDGKGRTLVQIDREISDLCEIAQVTARRVTKLESFIAASVPVPAKVNVRSDAASTVEAMTEAAASDEGWRGQLLTVGYGDDCRPWLTDPAHVYLYDDSNNRPEWLPRGDDGRSFQPESKETAADRRTCPPPPNLAEWWKPGAKVSKPDEALVMSVEAHRATCDKLRELHAFVKSLLPRVCECCRESIKAALGKADIPDDVLKL